MSVAAAKPSIAAKFAWLRPSRSQPLSRFVGIDIGVDRANVVALGDRHRDVRRSSQRKQKSLRWLARHQFSLPIDPLAAPPNDWVERVISSLMDRLPRSVDGDQNIVSVSLPLPWVHYQVVPASGIESSRQQCDAMFASSLFQSKSHLGYWPLQCGTPASPEAPVVIAAIAESAALDLAEAICTLGYQIERIVPHGVALLDAAQAMTGIDPQCTVVLNRSGGLIAMKNERSCGLCRLLPAVPNQVLIESQAVGLTLDAIRPWLSDIAAEITATRRYVQRGQKSQQVEPLLFCGDLATIPEVDEVLATLVDAPVARWSYAGKVRPRGWQSLEHETPDARFDDAEFAVALSLAYAAAGSVSGSVKK